VITIAELKIGGLFSGIGGLELGFHNAGGFRTVWTCDIAEYPSAVLAERWGLPNLGDISKVDWGAVEPVDVLVGGFPCQDISNAGKRAGITGERSGLWKEYLRAIKELKPRFVVAENVAALVTRGLDVVVEDLNAAGYTVEARIIAARDVGAPHKRERIFIIAHTNIDGCGDEGFVESELFVNRKTNDEEWFGRQSGPLFVGQNNVYEDVAHTEQQPINEEDNERKICVEEGCCVRLESDSSRKVGVGTDSNRRDVETHGSEGDCCGWPRFNDSSNCGCESCGVERWWTVEPGVGRVVNGVSRGLDSYVWRERIKALGNAVVPQVAQIVAERVKELASED
jgi:DNA (cytosine-5)-methyltransferase 1